MAQWLEHWIFIQEDPGSIPMKSGIFFQLCFIPLLRLSCRKMGARPGFEPGTSWDRVRFPRKAWKFFQLCFIPLLRLSCRKMGARPGLDFIHRKWLHVIINDDFLEKRECYDRALLPSIICLGRLRIASKYIFNL